MRIYYFYPFFLIALHTDTSCALFLVFLFLFCFQPKEQGKNGVTFASPHSSSSPKKALSLSAFSWLRSFDPSPTPDFLSGEWQSLIRWRSASICWKKEFQPQCFNLPCFRRREMRGHQFTPAKYSELILFSTKSSRVFWTKFFHI